MRSKYRLVAALAAALPLWAQGQTHVGPDNGYSMRGPSRSEIEREFSGDTDIRDQRQAQEARKQQLDAQQRQFELEQTVRTRQEQERQKLRWYCSVPAHQNEPACR